MFLSNDFFHSCPDSTALAHLISRWHIRDTNFDILLLAPISEPKDPDQESDEDERYRHRPVNPEPRADDLHVGRRIPLEDRHRE